VARIAVITDDPGWHGKRLKDALKIKGHEAVFLSLTECALIIEDSQLPIRMKGFEDRLPEGVFVRGIPGGSLEQVTFYLDVLHGLELLGITVYNGARAIERTVDKAMTSFMLQQAGIPTPAAWVLRDEVQALALVEREINAGHGVVQKPLFGSQGVGLRRYQQRDELKGFSDDQGVFYLQRYVDSGDSTHDFRVFVIGGKAVAAMRRSGVSWLNNVHQGGLCEAVHLDDIRLSRLAEDAVAVLEMAYAGVDIIRDRHGRYFILEVNSIPAWKGLQTVAPIAVAERLVDDFLSRTAHQAAKSQRTG
jgi:RimK family alpha-L-glutamate ligase